MGEVSIGGLFRIIGNLFNFQASTPTLDGVVIGSTTPAAGTFTTLGATTFAGNTTSNSGLVVNTSDFSKASTTTVATVTGLSVALSAAGTYEVFAYLPLSNVTAGGAKMTLKSSNSLSLTSANLTGLTYSGTTVVADTNITALDADFVSYANTSTLTVLTGSIVVNAAGTLNIAAAQNTSNATSSTVKAGAYLKVTKA